MKLILASASPRRAALLRQVGLTFEVEPGHVDENLAGCSPRDTVLRLAFTKAEQVAERLSGGLVIGADTIVEYRGRVLGKPGNKVEALEMLTTLSGKEHKVITGLALIDAASSRKETGFAETRVWMRALERELIEAYVATGEPMDKAGGYGIQGKAAFFVEKIEGCYFNVVGLPLNLLYRLLSRMGIKLCLAWRDDIEAGREPDY